MDVSQIIKYEMAMMTYKIKSKSIESNIEPHINAERRNHFTRQSTNYAKNNFHTNLGKFTTTCIDQFQCA